MELLPEETTKILFSKYRSRIVDLCPAVQKIAYNVDTWARFFILTLKELPWTEYVNLIHKLLQAGEKPLILVTLDYVQLPGELGVAYNSIWTSGYIHYNQVKDSLQERITTVRETEQKKYMDSCSKYRTEYFKNLGKYNDDYEAGLITKSKYTVKNNKAHVSYTALCTEEYDKMNKIMMEHENEAILEQYNAWKEIQDTLVSWLLQNVI